MKTKKLVAVFIIIFVIGIVLFSVYADDKIDLRLNLDKGQSYKLQTTQDLKINQTIPGQQQTITIIQKNATKNVYTVEDVQADSTIVLRIAYDAMAFKQQNPIQNQLVEYDSENPSTDAGPIAPIFDAVVGSSFTITITPDGHVKDIQGADAIFQSIQKKINEFPDAQARAAIETQIRTQFSEEALKANTESSFDMYPDTAISVGDTWTKRSTITQAFPMIIDTIYTLKERKDGIAIIDIFAMIQTNRDAGPAEMGNTKIQYNMSGSVTGILQMQESTGWPIRSKQNLRLTGSVMIQSPEMQQPISMPMSITGPITIEPY